MEKHPEAEEISYPSRRRLSSGASWSNVFAWSSPKNCSWSYCLLCSSPICCVKSWSNTRFSSGLGTALAIIVRNPNESTQSWQYLFMFMLFAVDSPKRILELKETKNLSEWFPYQNFFKNSSLPSSICDATRDVITESNVFWTKETWYIWILE